MSKFSADPARREISGFINSKNADQFKANIEGKDENYLTGILMEAIDQQWVDGVKILLEKGVAINSTEHNFDGKTPLSVAVSLRNEAIVEMLLEKGADVNKKSNKVSGSLAYSQKTPLHYAALESNTNIINKLIEKGADLNIQDKDGKTPLHYAVEFGGLNSVNALIEKGADLKIQDKDGKTPLHYAIESGKHNAVNALIEKGADLNKADRNGKTPLGIILEEVIFENSLKNRDFVKKLIKAGASLKENGIAQTLLKFDNKTRTDILKECISEDDTKPEIKQNVLNHLLQNVQLGNQLSTQRKDLAWEIKYSDDRLNFDMALDKAKLQTESFDDKINIGNYDNVIIWDILEDNKAKQFLSPEQTIQLKVVRKNPDSASIVLDDSLNNEQKLALLSLACNGDQDLLSEISILRKSPKFIKTSPEYKIIMGHSEDYIAMKIVESHKKGSNINFMEIIEKSPPEMVAKILSVAEKVADIKDSPPSIWKKLIFNLTDIANGIMRKKFDTKTLNNGANPNLTNQDAARHLRDLMSKNSKQTYYPPMQKNNSGEQISH